MKIMDKELLGVSAAIVFVGILNFLVIYYPLLIAGVF